MCMIIIHNLCGGVTELLVDLFTKETDLNNIVHVDAALSVVTPSLDIRGNKFVERNRHLHIDRVLSSLKSS